MNKFLFLLFFISISVFSQQEKDSVITVKMDSLFAAKDTIRKNSKTELFSDSDLKTINLHKILLEITTATEITLYLLPILMAMVV